MIRATILLEVDKPIPAVKENCSISSAGTSREAMESRVVSHIENLYVPLIIDLDSGQLSIAAEINA